MADREPAGNNKRNGNLRIPLPFDKAVKAALEVQPPPRKPRKPRSKKKI
jgi:hypothetical protein